MTNRIRQLEDAQWPIIVPVEDEMQIVHGPARFAGGECVMVECPTMRSNSDVETFVKEKTKIEWITPIPSRITGEFKTFLEGNPHINGKGMWVWLLVKI